MERRSYPLERLTSLRVGGPADRLAIPESESELRDALRSAAEERTQVRALGGGRNLLVSDEGVAGLVISLTRLKGTTVRGNLVIVAAGTSNGGLVGRAVAAGLGGLECLVGVPGTVGGSVRMNAGGAHGTIGERVVWVRGLTRWGEPFRFALASCGFRYRGSRLAGTFVTEVALRLPRAEPGYRSRLREVFERKRATQPLGAATAGCMFKNPPGVGKSAGWLLDRAGAKGIECGGARVSRLHANFVENRGGATCADVLAVAWEARSRVLDRFGVDLQYEVEIWRREEEKGLPLN